MKKLFIVMLAFGSLTCLADGYKLAPVERIEVLANKNIKLTYHLPCKDLDFETFVAAYDDSGDRELRIGVVYHCEKGSKKTFTRTLTPDWPEYTLFKGGFEEGASFVPMNVSKN